VATAGLVAVAIAAAFLLRGERAAPPAAGASGVADAHLTSGFWLERLAEPDRVLVDREYVEAQNRALLQRDDSLTDLRALPATLTRDRVIGWVNGLAAETPDGVYDVTGAPLADQALEEIAANRNLDAVPDEQRTRYGLVVRRADLRTFPTTERVFRSPGNTDIDRFQESALFPGTPVVIVHESADGGWWFVISPRYAAWIEKVHVAEGAPQEVLAYGERMPYRIVTGAKVETVFNPEEPAVSELQLDMGVRVPLVADWPADRAVNGQYPSATHVIELPLRTPAGTLQLTPALLQANADTSDDYLPLTRGNILRQGFKFLGERYGWGHSYNGRDCSGFVSEVYGSMGALLPRNTSDQGVSTALNKRIFSESDDAEVRIAAARALEVGDLVYIPGHVMMVIGQLDGEPWVIHDTTGASYRGPEGSMIRVPLNAVAVTPLLPLHFNESERYVDRMTSIVRVAADSTKDFDPL
jgi:cell wall-associated NlpC family hydrolase